MNMEEFLVEKEDKVEAQISEAETTEELINEPEELDVQKAVVESLAADKAEQDERIRQLKLEKTELEETKAKLESENGKLKSQFSALEDEVKRLKSELEKLAQQIIVNQESPLSSQVALLEREETLFEKFTGEFRDQVIAVIKEGRDLAEKDGRVRRAQILEAVLVANEPSGELDKRRQVVDKLFSENQNVINGTVIEELDKLGISHKNGEEYLLPSEIIKRNF